MIFPFRHLADLLDAERNFDFLEKFRFGGALSGPLDKPVIVALTGSAWVAPTFTNSWVNFGAPFENAGYLKDPFGFVHLRGMISTGTSGTSAFTLPAGFRPLGTQQFSMTTTAPSNGIVQIDSSGLVKPINGASVGTATSLSSISFLAEN